MMTPREIVQELGKHIVGQEKAKRAVAIALRNRWRRMRLPEDIRGEVVPKNILMVGATGVGKTEIARRLARLSDAPFVKVEATKFTEVGYVGRDVEAIIRDLMDVAVKSKRTNYNERNEMRAKDAVERRLVDALMKADKCSFSSSEEKTRSYKEYRSRLRKGELDRCEITAEINASPVDLEVVGPPNSELIPIHIRNLMKSITGRNRKLKKITVKRAMKLFLQEEYEALVDEDELRASALEDTEQKGIVFIDEIDKLTKRSDSGGGGGSGGEISREGVQRDLLPLIEGSTVNTKYGIVKTDHILFIASGAFHFSKPSDLIPELQGRLPIRVELKPLTAKDFYRILVEPRASLIRQYKELLSTEGCLVEFSDSAIHQIADMAYQINQNTENIGARRLHTVMEHLFEDLSFESPDRADKGVNIDVDYVNKMLKDIVTDRDLSRYIL